MEYMVYFQEKDEKQLIQQYKRAEGPIVPKQCHRLIASIPHLTDAVIWAKGAPTKVLFHNIQIFLDAPVYSTILTIYVNRGCSWPETKMATSYLG